MPSDRLLVCGLLSKYPTKSTVFQKINNPKKGMRYTDAEKMHITAMMWTPDLPKSWIWWQFQPYCKTSERKFMQRMRNICYNHRNRARWEHLGMQNIQYIGQPEVMRYYERANPNRQLRHPSWAVAQLVQHMKEGMKMVEIERMYGLPFRTMSKLRARGSMKFHGRRGSRPFPQRKEG